MERSIVCSPSTVELGAAIAAALGEQLLSVPVERFPDGELHVVVPAELTGREAVLVQSVTAPAGEKLIELALLADACQRAGASALTAVLPYFAYARQDHCTLAGEALGGKVLAQLVSAIGFERVIAVDLHSELIAAWLGERVSHLSALSGLAEAVRASLPPEAVIVSPDLGGAKRAERVARLLGLPLAIVHKSRLSGSQVVVHRVLGDVRGRTPVIVDDMISTGGTIEAAAAALRTEHCAPGLVVLATHALLVGDAVERLASARIDRLVHSDSVPCPRELPFEHVVIPLAPLLAESLRAGP